jgi:serine/threonine-protein kinase
VEVGIIMVLELRPGDVYAGNILVRDVLGTGSFANVYLVEVPSHERPLALKLTREPVTAGDQAQRALREITILRQLTNPHVVRPYDCGLRPDGHIYMLMDYLEGCALDQWHDFTHPLHPAQAVTVVHQACLALAEAHAKSIVHRDVKPENVFIETGGNIRMLDFGLARSWDGTPVVGMNATQSHMVVGTPHYSQPEQLTSRVLTPASDVYSLAIILYELLSARSPFHGDRPLIEVKQELCERPMLWLKAHALDEHTPIDRHPGCDQLPRALVAALDRALNKEPSRRPPDAGAFANVLGLALHRDLGIPVAATLKMLHPDQTLEDRLFLPGSHRVGSGERCEVKLRDDSVLRVHAVLEWSGIPNAPRIRPITGDGSVKLNDTAIVKPVEIRADDEFSVGNTRMAIAF